MQFIDHTGHQFTLPDYQNKPIGYEFDIDKYVFWLNSESTTHKLSVFNAYVLPIRFLVDNTTIENISIQMQQSDTDMPTYWLFGSQVIQDAIENESNVFEKTLTLANESISNVLNKEDLCIVPIDDKTSMCTFYVFGKSSTENCILAKCLIDVKYDSTSELYCPITIGGEWRTEEDGLTINGQNMGLNLPKEVLQAVYQSPFNFDYPDDALYSKKLKEALMAYTHIKAECGNYESVKDSLKWFGYGSHMNLSRLLKTDNQFISQYVHDNFDVKSDTLYAWKNFKNASLVSIWMNSNRELPNSIVWPEFDNEFWGEGHPLTEDLMHKLQKVVYDEKDIFFWKPWYDWMQDEMYLKMAALAYYWKEYFLPISLCINSASFRTLDFANDIKYVVGASASQTAYPVWIGNSEARVKFPDTNIIYLYNQQHYMDECYNDFTDNEYLGNNTDKQIIYINDVCAHIPIEFSGADFYDCQLILSRDENVLYKSHFEFSQNDESKYSSFVLIPKSIVKHTETSYWVNRIYLLSLQVNGNWYYYKFKLAVPEFQLSVGTLQYKYFISNETSLSLFNQVAKIHTERDATKDIRNINNREGKEWVEFNSFMYVPQLTETNDVNFFEKLKNSLENAKSITVSTNQQTISIENWLNYLASKCYIYNVGTDINNGMWKKGQKIVPIFLFNNGIDTEQINKEGYTLKDFQVDVLFDVDSDNIPYAKLTYNLDDIQNMMQSRGAVYCDQLKSYYTISDDTLKIRKKEILPTLEPVTDKAGNIDWDATSTDWRAFYIDSYLVQKSNFTIRFVTTITIGLPNGDTWTYGGYDINGNPKLFKDLLIEVWHRNTSSNICNLDCQCVLEKHCKFKQWKYGNNNKQDTNSAFYNNGAYEVKPKDDDNADYNQLFKFVSENTKKMIDSLVAEESYNIYINNNKKYLNRIHIYKLFVDKAPINNEFGFVANSVKEVPYDSNIFDTKFYKDGCYEQPKALTDLYKLFFDNNGKCKLEVGGNAWFKYDFYLVHDADYWFVVFISQMTEDVAISNNDLNLLDKIVYKPNNEYTFRMERWRSGDRFLINRMMFEKSTPKNHFNQDDLIMMTIDNVKFPYILSQTTKWNIKPLSLKYANKNLEVQGKSNAAILSLPDSKSEYMPGYYNIDVRYSVDGLVDHQQKKQRRILIK